MITEFFDVGGVSVHDQFQAWRTNHQDGLFLNSLSRNRAALQGARCKHLGSSSPYGSAEAVGGSLTANRKVCGALEELLSWAAEQEIWVKPCLHCLRDSLIGSAQVQECKEGLWLPEEVPGGSTFSEGSVQRILVNRHERNPLARGK